MSSLRRSRDRTGSAGHVRDLPDAIFLDLGVPGMTGFEVSGTTSKKILLTRKHPCNHLDIEDSRRPRS